MKKLTRVLVGALGFAIGSIMPAFAVDTSLTYRSSWLVLGFLGLFAAIVVVQLVPAIVLMYGMVKGMVFEDATKEVTTKK